MHRKGGERTRKQDTSSGRKNRKGFNIPFLLNTESRGADSSASSCAPSSCAPSSCAPSSSSASSSQVSASSSRHGRRSSFDRTRASRHREPRPLPIQDTSPPFQNDVQSMADLRGHMSVSSDSQKHTTRQGSMNFDREATLSSIRPQHLKDSSNLKNTRKSPTHCLKCDKTFKTVADMQKHDKETHLRVERLQMFECPVCHLTFRDASNANKHFRAVHEGRKGFECKVCRKQLSGPESLARHVKNVHDNVRDARCPHCLKSFKQGAHMRKHIETQHGEALAGDYSAGPSSRRDSEKGRSTRSSSSRNLR